MTSGVCVCKVKEAKMVVNPIVGGLPLNDFYPTAWLYIGLSSRRLLYHVLYESLLVRLIKRFTAGQRRQNDNLCRY